MEAESLLAESCGCDPCEVDLTGYGYEVGYEDPTFRNSQCLWHRIIVGKRGTISPEKDGQIWVELTAERDWPKIETAAVRNGWRQVGWDAAVAPVGDIHKAARLIGAKRKRNS